MALNESELRQCCTMLGVNPDITPEALERIYVTKAYALLKLGAPEAERARLSEAHAKLRAHLGPRLANGQGAPGEAECGSAVVPSAAAPLPAPPLPVQPPPSSPEAWHPFSFDRPLVNLVAVPVVAALAILTTQSFLGFLLEGFHVWVHEFGHATVAWFTGRRALPLPIGWTNISPEKSLFVYLGILLLLGLLFVAGWRERKPTPMLMAAGLAVLQGYMTWGLPEDSARLWRIFAGCGGQFYLSALMVGSFYFELPEKFEWGKCRYVFLFIGASSFFDAYTFWRNVKFGRLPVPYGSMINGEGDTNGDMDILSTDFGWSDRHIISTYNHLGNACLAALAVIYVVFVLRLDRFPIIFLQRFRWWLPAE
jgi:hypothetical protein